ncbi:MAG: hypothetical protein JNK33_00340 [Candidatus Doudnabacteria bacterium]|nr:hypothetical protein [Candidatus Doudnabacteria bacterium]
MEEINLYELLRFYRKHWLKIAGATLLGLVLAVNYTLWGQKPMYKSEATLIVVSKLESSPIAQGSSQLSDYPLLIKSRRVLEPVIRQHHINLDYTSLQQNISANNDKDTRLISLSVKSTDAVTSQRLANSIIVSFREQVKAIYGTDDIKIVDDASLPKKPANVRRTAQIALGAMGGFLVSVLALFFAFDFAQSQTANFTAAERLVYEKTRQAERAKALTLKLEQQAARASVRRERRTARAERRAALLKRWADTRAARAIARAEKRSQQLEARVKRTELRLEAQKAKEAARQAVKQAKIAAATERRAEAARLKAEKMKLEASEKAIRLRAEERRRKDEERRRKEEAAARKAELAAQEAARKEAEKAEAERKAAEEARAKAEAEAEATAKKAALEAEATAKKVEAEAKAKAKKEAAELRKAVEIEARAQARVLKLQESRKKKSRFRRKKSPAISLRDLTDIASKES